MVFFFETNSTYTSALPLMCTFENADAININNYYNYINHLSLSELLRLSRHSGFRLTFGTAPLMIVTFKILSIVCHIHINNAMLCRTTQLIVFIVSQWLQCAIINNIVIITRKNKNYYYDWEKRITMRDF